MQETNTSCYLLNVYLLFLFWFLNCVTYITYSKKKLRKKCIFQQCIHSKGSFLFYGDHIHSNIQAKFKRKSKHLREHESQNNARMQF